MLQKIQKVAWEFVSLVIILLIVIMLGVLSDASGFTKWFNTLVMG